MKAIIVRQKSLDGMFAALLEGKYGYDHTFMTADEIHSDFIKTERYHMLCDFRDTLRELKVKIEEAP